MAERAAVTLAGQVVIGAFDGTSLPDQTARAIAAGALGGVTLFGRNVESPRQVAAVTRAIAAAAPSGMPPLVAIDQEGGRVQRVRAPFLELPPMRAVGTRGDVALTERLARVLGAELRAGGVTLDFAPVCDVDSNPDNSVIGDRSFGRDPATVSRHAAAFVRGLAAAGLASCAKHFPGHGDTTTDSHHELPVLERDRARLDALELAPFRAAIAAGVDAVMTAHVVCRGVDPERPATLSPEVLRILKVEMGFGGMVVSDDLEMKAIRLPVGEAAVAAIAAGCDAVLVCRQPELMEAARLALADEAGRSPAFAARLANAVERCLVVRRRVPPRPLSDDALAALLDGPDHRALAVELRLAMQGS